MFHFISLVIFNPLIWFNVMVSFVDFYGDESGSNFLSYFRPKLAGDYLTWPWLCWNHRNTRLMPVGRTHVVVDLSEAF